MLNGNRARAGRHLYRSLSVDNSGAQRRVALGRPTTRRPRSRRAKPAGELDAINATIPNYLAKIDAVANDAARSGQPGSTAPSAVSIATARQNQTAAGSLQFNVALDNGSFATVSIAGSGLVRCRRGGNAAKLRCRARVNTAVGAGNATVTGYGWQTVHR